MSEQQFLFQGEARKLIDTAPKEQKRETWEQNWATIRNNRGLSD